MAGYQGLYHPSFEHDACGIGFVANIKGHKSHQHISDALTVLENILPGEVSGNAHRNRLNDNQGGFTHAGRCHQQTKLAAQ